MLTWWHEKMALKYSDKMYPMKEDYFLYDLYKAKFDYHMFMLKWYHDLNNIKR